jgi:glutathione S-transferase
MYTLYYSQGACSLVIHCLLEELGVPFEAKRVSLKDEEHKSAEYRKVNPKERVPALVTPEGTLTECVAIIETLCNKHGDALLGKPGSWERARNMERIVTLATEVHPVYHRFFHTADFGEDAAVQEGVKKRGAEKLVEWFRAQDAALTTTYWSGNTPSIADHYFMTVARWGRFLEPPVTRMKNIEPFMKRMGERPAVARAMAREGITPFGLVS